MFLQAQDQEHLSVVHLGGAQAPISILSFPVTRTFDCADGIPPYLFHGTYVPSRPSGHLI